jgi:hypothetical protein
MTCQQAAEVITRSVDTPLAVSERCGLGVHTLFCGPCRRFRWQILRLHMACQHAMDEDVSPCEGKLSVEACGRIAAALEHPSAE